MEIDTTRRYTVAQVYEFPADGCRYELRGTPEFWFVDLDTDVIEQYVLSADAPPQPPAVHHRGATFTSVLFAGLVLDVDDLLGPPEPRQHQ